MAKLLRGSFIDENKLRVEIIYNLEAKENHGVDTTNGVVVDEELQMPDPKIGKAFHWFVNPQTKEQWFEELDRPLTKEEQVELLLSQQQEQLDALVVDALMGGATNV